MFLRCGIGGEYFPEFDDTDFAPLTVDVETDGGEFTTPVGFIGIDWVIG